MKKAEFKLEELSCPSCLMKIDKAVKSHKEVVKSSVNVMFNSSKVTFDFNDDFDVNIVKDSIEKLGFDVLKVNVE